MGYRINLRMPIVMNEDSINVNDQIVLNDGRIEIDDRIVKKFGNLFGLDNPFSNTSTLVMRSILIATSMIGGVLLTNYEYYKIEEKKNKGKKISKILLVSKRSPFGITLMFIKNSMFTFFAVSVPIMVYRFALPKLFP